MWQRFTLYDLRIIAHYLGTLMLFLCLALCAPFIVAAVMQEWEPAARYLFAIGVSLCIAMGLRMCYIAPGQLNARQAIAVTALAWLILAIVGAIPLYFSGHFCSYLDALFESMSGITTTGASVVQDLDHLSMADNMWRFTMQLVGGQGVIVIALSLGMFGSAINSSLYSSEGRSEHVVPNIMQTTKFIVRFSLLFIGVGVVVMTALCLWLGMDGWRAFFNGLWLSIASFNTGGMTAMSPGIVYYHCGPLEMVAMVLILVGSINFTLHNEIWKGRIKEFVKDIEVVTLALWLGVAVFVFTLATCAAGVYDDLPTLLRRTVFTVVAAFSSTGFQTITANQLTTVISSGALLILVFCMAMGGSAGSTTGGIKAFRVGILLKEVVAYIKEVLAPDSARQVVMYNHVGRHPLTNSLVRANLAVFMLFCASFLISTIATVAFGYDAAEAMFESVSMASNIGMSVGIISPGMPDALKILYIIDMWAGRLEYVALIALIASLIMSFKPRKKVRRG